MLREDKGTEKREEENTEQIFSGKLTAKSLEHNKEKER